MPTTTQTITLKEVTKQDGQAYTNLLDPYGNKPYLVLDQNTNTYHVLYWKAWFHNRTPKPGLWSGSDWYDNPNPKRDTKPSRKANSWPKRCRVFQLPGIKYAKPKNYTDPPKP